MSAPSGQTRRAFLGTAIATGAGVVLLGDGAGAARLEWCTKPVFPLAEKTLHVVRGELPAGVVVGLEVIAEGPAFEQPVVLVAHTLTLRRAVEPWTFRLPYSHPELVPGRYTFRVRATAGDAALLSPEIAYSLRPFVFGV